MWAQHNIIDGRVNTTTFIYNLKNLQGLKEHQYSAKWGFLFQGSRRFPHTSKSCFSPAPAPEECQTCFPLIHSYLDMPNAEENKSPKQLTRCFKNVVWLKRLLPWNEDPHCGIQYLQLFVKTLWSSHPNDYGDPPCLPPSPLPSFLLRLCGGDRGRKRAEKPSNLRRPIRSLWW